MSAHLKKAYTEALENQTQLRLSRLLIEQWVTSFITKRNSLENLQVKQIISGLALKDSIVQKLCKQSPLLQCIFAERTLLLSVVEKLIQAPVVSQ